MDKLMSLPVTRPARAAIVALVGLGAVHAMACGDSNTPGGDGGQGADVAGDLVEPFAGVLAPPPDCACAGVCTIV